MSKQGLLLLKVLATHFLTSSSVIIVHRELLRGECFNTPSSDMYSFGVLLYEAYSRKEPYEGEDTMTVLVQVADPIVNKRPPIPSACSPQIRSLMAECFVNTPEYRPTFETAVEVI